MDGITKIILAMAMFLMVMIALVIGVGLLQRTLNTTGTVTMLVGAFTGLMSGFYLRGRNRSDE